MFCPKCGTKLPDDATFCGNCGTRIGEAAQPAQPEQPKPEKAPTPMFKRLLDELKAFFTGKPEAGIDIATESTSHEWSLLIGGNITLFALAFGIYGAINKLGFGYYLLFGLLIGIIAVGVMIGVCFLMPVFAHKKINPITILNIVAYSTIPLSAGALLVMPFAPMWGYFLEVIMAAAVAVQVLIIYLSLKKLLGDDMKLFLFVIIAFAACITIGAFFKIFNNAAAQSSYNAIYNSLHGLSLYDLY